MTKSEIWTLSEWTVAQDRVVHHGESLVRHRFETPFAEVDLLTRCRETKTLKMIEVKSSLAAIDRAQADNYLDDYLDDYLLVAISPPQLNRLRKAVAWLASIVSEPIELTLAVVSQPQGLFDPLEIQYFDLEDDHY